MSDTTQTNGQQNGAVVTQEDEVQLIIPEETQEKFPQLVDEIKGSKSMDNKERNYWLQVLPVMTDEQINELKDILSTERQKLAEIEQKYASTTGATEIGKPQKTPEEIEAERKKIEQRKMEQRQKELLARKEENVEDILSQLDFA